MKELESRLDEFESFSKDHSFPERVGHMDFLLEEIGPEMIISGPAIPIPNSTSNIIPNVIVVEGTQTLTQNTGQLIVEMRELFPIVAAGVIKEKFDCSDRQSKILLNKLVDKIMDETGWDKRITLLHILVREHLAPSIISNNINLQSGLEDTFKIYLSKDPNDIQFAGIPFHAASMKLGDIVVRDFDDGQDYGIEDYGDDYDFGDDTEYDLGEP